MWKMLKQILKKLNNIEKRIAGLESAIQDRQGTEVLIELSDGCSNDLIEKYSEDRKVNCGRTVSNHNVF